MYTINKKFFCRIILVLLISIVFSGCRNIDTNTPVLSAEDISVQILHHQFDDISGEDLDFLAFIVSIDHDDVVREDLSVEINGIESFCVINDDLTNNPTYTTDYFNSKVGLDENNISLVEYFIIETNNDIHKSILSDVEIIVNYKSQSIKNSRGFVYSEI